MRIAISCTGEGLGHAARTSAIAQALRGKYDITVFCPAHLFGFMRENLSEVRLEQIPYFFFVKHRDRIDYPRTVLRNLPQAFRFPLDVSRIATKLKRLGIEALISDYDPYGAYAADSLGMPILQINHPAVVLRQRHFSLESWTARILSLLLMGKYHRKLVVSFYDGDLGPVVRPAVVQTPAGDEGFFVVYLKPSYRKVILRALKRLAIHDVQVFPDPQKNIVDYLARCRGVISSAGHQFMSEALVLRKPVFAIPQQGQYEQWLNATMLEQSGWGTWARMDELDEKLSRFVNEVSSYPKPSVNPSVRYRFDNDLNRAVAKIESFLRQSGRSREPAAPLQDRKPIGTAHARQPRH